MERLYTFMHVVRVELELAFQPILVDANLAVIKLERPLYLVSACLPVLAPVLTTLLLPCLHKVLIFFELLHGFLALFLLHGLQHVLLFEVALARSVLQLVMRQLVLEQLIFDDLEVLARSNARALNTVLFLANVRQLGG